MEVGKVLKRGEDFFFYFLFFIFFYLFIYLFFFFAFHFWKRRKFVLGLPKWEKAFHVWKKSEKMTLPLRKICLLCPWGDPDDWPHDWQKISLLWWEESLPFSFYQTLLSPRHATSPRDTPSHSTGSRPKWLAYQYSGSVQMFVSDLFLYNNQKSSHFSFCNPTTCSFSNLFKSVSVIRKIKEINHLHRHD